MQGNALRSRWNSGGGMSNEVYANTREVACKQAAGKSICAFPDVCMTPPQTPATPPGVPIPYPNTGMASDTSDGSTTVKISGEEVMLKNKSCFKKSTGDEAGAAPMKGVVTHKNTGKVYFTMWSMDVKVEGENVVRMMDLTTHNHGSQPGNTPPWPYTDKVAPPPPLLLCLRGQEMSTHAARSRHPVIIATGEKSLDQLDFQLPGPIELEWRRQYRSGDARNDGWFGQGWSHPLATELWIEEDVLRYWDEQGREVVLPAIAVGQEHFQAYEQFTLIRPGANRWALRHNQGLTHHFRQRHANQWRLPLEVIQDRNRRRLLLHFNDGDFGNDFDAQAAPPRPQRLIDSAGRTLHLEWTDHRQLSQVVVVSGDTRVILASYRYGSIASSADGLPDLLSHTGANGYTRTFHGISTCWWATHSPPVSVSATAMTG